MATISSSLKEHAAKVTMQATENTSATMRETTFTLCWYSFLMANLQTMNATTSAMAIHSITVVHRVVASSISEGTKKLTMSPHSEFARSELNIKPPFTAVKLCITRARTVCGRASSYQ